MKKDELINEMLKLKYGNLEMMDNFKDIGNFLENNINDVKDVSLFYSGGGIWIYYILIDGKVYSIGDELFDGKNNCIVYYGFNSIDEFMNFEDEMYETNIDLSYDDVKQEFIKI